MCRHLKVKVWDCVRKKCALFHVYILSLQEFLPLTTPILTSRAPLEAEIFKLFNGVLMSGNDAVVAKLCLEDLFGPLCLRNV